MKQIKLFILLVILYPNVLFSQQGTSLDSTFGNNGMVFREEGVCGELLADQNSKILCSGVEYINGETIYSVYRLNNNGSIDNHFAVNGCFHPSVGGVGPMCLQTDGKILLGGSVDTTWGSSDYDFMIIRLNADGTLDSTFNNNGAVITDMAHYWHGIWMTHLRDGLYDISQQSDGKIIAYGTSWGDVALARYTTEGQIDSTFGTYGIASYIVGNYENQTNDMVVLPDNRILIGLESYIGQNSEMSMVVMRLLPNGQIDSTFNQTGLASYSDGWLTYCKAMCVQPDGKVLLTGYSADSTIIVRFDTTGMLDVTFGNNGVSKLPLVKVSDMVLNPDNRILIAGSKDSNFIIYRCQTNGAMDSAFGVNGVVGSTGQSGFWGHSSCIALQSDKILVGGRAALNNDLVGHFAIARYRTNSTGITETPFENQSLLIYPNPAKDKLLIRWRGESQPKPVTISLYDISGRRLWYQERQTISNQPFTIDVSALTPGVYFVRITDDKGLNEQRKFVKK